MGRPLLVADVDEPLDLTVSRLAGHVGVREGEWRVQLADKEVKVADGFRLYVTTRIARPRLSDETPAHVNVVDFTLSEDALTDQLLGYIFQLEKPVSIQPSSGVTNEALAPPHFQKVRIIIVPRHQSGEALSTSADRPSVRLYISHALAKKRCVS